MSVEKSHIRNILIAAMGTLILALLPGTTHARLSGEAELGYVKADTEAGGAKVLDASSFYQRYSILYSTQGALYQGRMGGYDLALGYEWGSFDTSIKDPSRPNDPLGNASLSLSRGHLLYRGEFYLDPQELPLKLKVYSYDMSRITMDRDTLTSLGSGMTQPGLVTSLEDGTHIITGATLLLGVKSGLTNGYNAIFRHIPLVMLDYRDEINRDLKSLTPIDTRLRRLAFVSLNKRDNWFHYRTTRFEDYLNSSNSFEENQIQLGTVDQSLTRRWIDMTNWLKISADGMHTKRVAKDTTTSFEEYQLNLFGIAERKAWQARTFSSYTRTKDNLGTTLERRIPLYAAGVAGQDAEWNANAYSQETDVTPPVGRPYTTSNISGAIRATMFKRSQFTLSPSLKAEHNDSREGKLLSLEGGIETASTRRFSDVFTVAAGYDVKVFRGDGVRGSSQYTNHDATLRVGYVPGSTVRVTFLENLTAASGQNPQNYSNSQITINNGFGGTVSSSAAADLYDRNRNTIDGYVRSVSSADVAWIPLPRLQLTFGVSQDFLSPDNAPSDSLTTLRNTINYSTPTFTTTLENSFWLRSVGGGVDHLIESRGTIDYRPDKSLANLLQYTFSKRQDHDGTDYQYVDLVQRLTYSFYSRAGVSSKPLEISEEFNYNKTTTINGGVMSEGSAKRFTLSARYYPVRFLLLGVTSRFSFIEPEGAFEQTYEGVMALTFRKFQASLNYSYGRRNELGGIIEKRLSANVKKVF